MSFEALCEGEASVLEVTRFLDSSGFRLAAVVPRIPDLETGFPLQIDGIFLGH